MNQPLNPDGPNDRPARDDRAHFLEDPLTRFDARILDPTTAVRLTNGEAPSATIYVGDTLLVTAASADDARELLELLPRAIELSRLPLRWVADDPFRPNDTPEHDRRARLLTLAAERKLPLVFPVRFEPDVDGPAPAVDVWPLLQAVRQAAARDEDFKRLSGALGLNHLMSAAAAISGNPFMRGMATIVGDPFMRGMVSVGGNPFMRGMGGVNSYLSAGSGGRGPVSVVLPPPLRSSSERPHVVVLDTGVGAHPWFDAQAITIGLSFVDPGNPGDPPLWIGMDPHDPDVIASDPEADGSIPDSMTGLLASHSGHGTFIAGLLRQACADADITAIRVMDSDGVVPEVVLTDALTGLGVVQSEGAAFVDAVVLSLGYYCESGDDVTYTAGLRPLILSLAATGLAIFCAAGNDSTMQRSYPAAFSDAPEFKDGSCLPMASVAALNPDLTVALFSNEGTWVNAEAPGASLVSTSPVRFQGAWSAETSFVGPRKAQRGSVDADSFRSGFSTWSGTSFAAPVLAGRYLADLVALAPGRTVEERAPLVGLRRS